VPFTPWTTLDDYREILDFVEREALVDAVDPVQYSIRLLVPPGSLLVESPAMRPYLGPLVEHDFYYRWTHPDPRVDTLQERVAALVAEAAEAREDAAVTFHRVRALADEAAAAAADYELVPLDGPTPESRLTDMSALFEAINDAPLDDADMEDDSYPVERIRRYEAARAAQGQHIYRLIAKHRRTGEWVGFTLLCVDELRPGLAFQEDTSVMRQHRGHRLGILLKARMLLWMRERHPELCSIDTWNADSNIHMVAVNEQLGCFVANRGYLMQQRLE
jgi:hypothetical protein